MIFSPLFIAEKANFALSVQLFGTKHENPVPVYKYKDRTEKTQSCGATLFTGGSPVTHGEQTLPDAVNGALPLKLIGQKAVRHTLSGPLYCTAFCPFPALGALW
jgi:hypothetical protein